MKVTLLGTSAAEGWPGLFCRCEACGKARKLRGRNIRTRSSALVDGVLKIDFPPDTLHHVIEYDIDLRCLKALLFTHAHDDHFSWPELQYRGEHFVPQPIPDKLPVYGPSDVIQGIEMRLNLDLVPITLHTLCAWNTAQIAGYRITPILAQHDPEQTCFNYIITDEEGATVLYATDTGWYEPPTWRFLQSVSLDAVVVECSKGPIEGGYMAHMCIPEVVRMRQKLIEMRTLQAGAPFVTTHFSHLGGLMHRELEERLNPEQIQVGYDGMNITVNATDSQ